MFKLKISGQALVINKEFWDVSHNGYESTITIDTVGGVAPTSTDNLYSLLKTMIS